MHIASKHNLVCYIVDFSVWLQNVNNPLRWNTVFTSIPNHPVRDSFPTAAFENNIFWAGGWVSRGVASDFFEFNVHSREVAVIQPDLDARSTTSAPVYAQNGNILYFFSGRNEQKELHIGFVQYSLETTEWRDIQLGAISPSPRIGASMVAEGDFLFLFGGKASDSQYMV